MRSTRIWLTRAVLLATTLLTVTACVAYEPAPRYGYYEGPGYYGPHYYYGGGYYRER